MDWHNAPLPQRIGPYRIVARLGQGGMGQVYVGRSPGGMKVAVKVIRPQRADDVEFRRRFAREVQAARQVNSAYTAAVVDADSEADEPWLATVHVSGVALDKALRQHGPWPSGSVRALGAGLVEALSAIHTAGIIHRDLKPSNVILTSNGPRVIDFGISAVAGATTMTAPGAFIGTPGFASPEQIQDQEVGPATDVFSLGVLLAHTATGHNPFGRHTTNPELLFYRTLHEPPTLDGLPSDLYAVIAACLAKNPAARPTPAALLAQLVEPTDDLVTVLGTDAWLPPAVAELAALRATAPTGPTPQGTALPQVPAEPTAPLTAQATVPEGPATSDTENANIAGGGDTPRHPEATRASLHEAATAPATPDTASGHRAANRRAHRTPSRRIAPALTGSVLALALLATSGWWWTQRNDAPQSPAASGADTAKPSPTPTPSATASPTPSRKGTPTSKAESSPDPAADTATLPTPPSEIPEPEWHCRDFMSDPVAQFSFAPCVASIGPRHVGYKVLVNSPKAQTITLYYWLGRSAPGQTNDELISYRQTCTLELAADQTKECKPFSSQPKTPGYLHAAATGSTTGLDGANSPDWYFDGQTLTHKA